MTDLRKRLEKIVLQECSGNEVRARRIVRDLLAAPDIAITITPLSAT